MGTQKNRLIDGSFEYPKHMIKLKGKKYSHFYAQKFCLSKPMTLLLEKQSGSSLLYRQAFLMKYAQLSAEGR